ncbi:MAG TPA: tyrosine--tRNA ligase [Candidatus Pacearchaeota archaeon]|nr:tyrosine--tRNA ligase [Candidatus Pacearchaeota archaeon]HRR94846.1 tyrosine--tRNA ligase [Candidatus Paceibacterota bacterium]HPC30605.1 tyrosine--tRNA ligase [Candidatus Pacearchaeota archaeon]HQG09349.1 tyrosine--tRNA ligase [Candidatus Pacearchaeota archaeon]HQH20218.1 tyrosine--tRNA ligase [Candidatus Pacearchaeota archaeon]
MKIDTNPEKIKEILERGTEDIIDKKHLEKALLSGKKLNIKFGIDPTGPKIHLGRATALLKLKDFQELGHKIILIIGNFTAQIGDASDKDSLRRPLTEDEIKKNLETYLIQIGKILDINKVQVCYNEQWLSVLKLRTLLSLSMNFTAQQMIQRRNFKERWEAGKPIGLHEMFYPILQGYDSVAVNADIEIGGFDQLFNLKIGREVQKFFGMEPQDIMTLKMIYGLDGRKMSTSWGNVINISDEPNLMFDKIMSLKDNLIINYFECCTRVPIEQVKKYEKALNDKKVNPKEIKKILARAIVSQFYSEEIALKAEAEFEKVAEKKELPSEIQKIIINETKLNILDLLIKLQLVKSKSEARRLVEQGGVKFIFGNRAEIKTDWQEIVKIKKGIVVQAGKKNFREIS